jgi:primosomal protein N''
MGPERNAEQLEKMGQMLNDGQMEILHAYLQGYRDRLNRLERRIEEQTLTIHYLRQRFAEATDAFSQLITIWGKMEDRITHLERQDDVSQTLGDEMLLDRRDGPGS